MAVYQGSKGMTRMSTKAKKPGARTIVGKGVKVRRVKARTPVGGDDIGG